MNLRKIVVFAAVLLSMAGASLFARTILVSYDVFLDVPGEMQQDAYIRRTAVELESGVMDELYNRGHIVFNAPGAMYTDALIDDQGRLQTMLARLDREADSGGAGMVVYLRLKYEAVDDDEVQLVRVDYTVYTSGSGSQILATGTVDFEPDAVVAISGMEAAAVVFNRLSMAALF